MKKFAIIAGKGAKIVSKIKGTGGSALPGLVVEKINPNFLTEVLHDVPVVVISGTNGKTTTTKIMTELLRDYGMKVFTNHTGSNFTRGIASEILNNIKRGRFDFDIAVLELDEAHAVQFVNKVKPKYSLLLNVLRDQLDRFGEIDTTAKFLQKVADATADLVITNANDPLLNKIGKKHFGYNEKLAKLFPSDDELYGIKDKISLPKSDVELLNITKNKVVFNIGETTLKLPGAHNALNSAAALTLVKNILGEKFDAKKSLNTLNKITPAFGRGESLKINGHNLDLILVKNPAGFRVALASQNNQNAATMIAINDEYADGRDMSWLWDVDFGILKNLVQISGIRAYDMALRLQCQEIKLGKINPEIGEALQEFLQNDGDKQIYCTYTAMLKIRKLLSKQTEVEKIL